MFLYISVMDVYTGPKGFLSDGNLLRPQLLIHSSTIDPQTSRTVSKAIYGCKLKEDRGSCKLEYNITLLRVTEPLEERVEQALFSPPLSKQRVEFAVDFGCGSGCLLDSLLLYPISLEKIVGVDISRRSLARAAKSLHTKLNSLLDTKDASSVIKSAVLYDGSITTYDSRLHGFDIATCLEVIEHMEEKDACLFGDVVLSSLCPKILIVSTPNYEYNVILQGSTPQSQEENTDEKHRAQRCKL